MSWDERLRFCQYRSPSGSLFTLEFDELIREAGKKAPVTEFPGQNQAAVQDLGQTAKRFPMVLYISGPDYDVKADQFWTALNESGPAQLSHPRYGDIIVLPVAVQQRETFVEEAGKAVFEVDFVEAPPAALAFPFPVSFSPPAVIDGALAAAETAAAALDGIDVEEIGAQAQIAGGLREVLDGVTGFFDSITEFSDDVRAEVNGVVSTILNEVGALVQAPANMVRSLIQLYSLPLTIIASVEAKVNGFVQLATSLVDLFVDRTNEYGDLFERIGIANLAAAVACGAGATAVGEIETRETAAEVTRSTQALQTILESRPTPDAISGSDYETRQEVRQVITNATALTLDRSLNLPIEQRTTLEYDEALLPLMHRLYFEIDDIDQAIGEFIAYNRLQGTEILIVPAGRTVRWYER